MTPLVFMFWAPHIYFPWSGPVTQAIDPDVNWFAQTIKPGAGDPAVERRAFDVASYGKQLGLITDVLLEQAERAGTPDTPAVARLRGVRDRIAAIKAEEYGVVEEALAERVTQVRERGGVEFDALARLLLPLLAQAPAVTQGGRA